MEPLDQQIDEALKDARPRTGPARILIAADEAMCSEDMVAALRCKGHEIVRVVQLKDSVRLLQAQQFEILLLDPDLPDGDGFDMLSTEAKPHCCWKTIILSHENTAQAAIRAMRCGAVDFLCPSASTADNAAELVDRVEAALHTARAHRSREERLDRLKRICRELNIARHQISEQIDILCHDLVCAYQEANAQLDDVAMATEFRTLVRQELDVEDLLRTTLEYTLTKTGPTNAAVFLFEGREHAADSSGFGLGAYVNYDCPRESVAGVLDRLCHAICPQMEAEPEIVSFDDAAEFAEWLGMESGMLGESQVIAFSCKHEGECLAVVVLFRAKSNPFPDELGDVIDTLRPIFAEQLARVVHVHHRARPQWPKEAPGGCEDDEFGFDEHGFGFGGLAA